MRPGQGRAALLGLTALLTIGLWLGWMGQLRPAGGPSTGPGATTELALDSAYLWQRRWTPQVRSAIRDGGVVLRELRVLALEIDAAGVSTRIAVDLPALASSGMAIVPVVRIDGRRPPLAATELAQQLKAVLEEWRAAGLAVGSIELDHDCARSGLGAYADWIRLLRTQLPGGLGLDLTGLPDWLHSPELALLLTRIDDFTLQVHAVDRPEAGLFDRGRALRWARQFSHAHPGRDFRIALPTYAARIQGTLYWARPEDAEALLASLRGQAVAGLTGVRWFRLPVPDATDTWSLATLAAIVGGHPRHAVLTLEARPAGNGAVDVWLRNDSAFDWPVPARVRVNGDCMGDGAGGFRLNAGPGAAAGLVFLAAEADRLAPARQRPLGWLRCTALPELALDAPLVESSHASPAPDPPH